MMFGKSRNPKIMVEIIGSARTQRKKLEIDESGGKSQVIVNPGGKGRGDVQQTATFTRSCLVPFKTGIFFKSTKYKLILKEGASSCIDFSDDSQDSDAPSCTQAQIKTYFRAQCLRAAGNLTGKEQKLTLVYILLIAVLIVTIVGILVSTGKIQFR